MGGVPVSGLDFGLGNTGVDVRVRRPSIRTGYAFGNSVPLRYYKSFLRRTPIVLI
jgi:hypothetical protein